MFSDNYFNTSVFKELIVIAVDSFQRNYMTWGWVCDCDGRHKEYTQRLSGEPHGKIVTWKGMKEMPYLTDVACEADSRTALMCSALNRLFLLLDSRLVRSVLCYQSRPLIDVMQFNKQTVSRRPSYKVALLKYSRAKRTGLSAVLWQHFSISKLILWFSLHVN
jgi:hypothetical protein